MHVAFSETIKGAAVFAGVLCIFIVHVISKVDYHYYGIYIGAILVCERKYYYC
jgi:hypothetical protein